MPGQSAGDSSPDDLCVCGAERRAHGVLHTHGFTDDDPEHPAEPEPAGEPGTPEEFPRFRLTEAGEAVMAHVDVREAHSGNAEPEAETPEGISLAERIRRISERSEFKKLAEALDSSGPVLPEVCHCGIGTPEECATGPAGCGPNSKDPRRPPYAVAYAVEGGAQYEVALPGDASVRAVDGALQITHVSPVLALTGIRPMEG